MSFNCGRKFIDEFFTWNKLSAADVGQNATKKIKKSKRMKIKKENNGDFWERITLHGIGDWYRADTMVVKTFWLIVFFGAIGASAYGCYAILEQYLESPVVVSYFVQQPTEEKLLIPDVIVCPFNRFDKHYLQKHNISDDLATYIELAFGLASKHPYQRNATMVAFAKTAANWTKHRVDLNDTLTRLNLTFEELLDVSSIPCKDILVQCSGANGLFDCCNGSSVMSGSGLCYRVQGDEQKGSGYPFAMTIIINLPKERYNLMPNNMLNDGIAIKLAERNKGMDFDLTFIPVGAHAIMPLKATHYEFMNDPPRYECLMPEDENYSHMACLDRCLFEQAQISCGCSHPADSYPSTLPACTTNEVYGCLYYAFANKTFIDDLLTSCRRKCKPRCNYWQYSAAVSYTKFPLQSSRKFVNNDAEWEKMTNSIVLDVYFERSEYTVIKHYSAMTVHSFIANIGGQYSLWLGGSILTLMQVIVFILQYFCTVFSASGRPSRDRDALHRRIGSTPNDEDELSKISHNNNNHHQLVPKMSRQKSSSAQLLNCESPDSAKFNRNLEY